ncbi:MAG TPA: hypothetical protein VI111_01735 [Thermoleophilaceae bacterium]
MSAQRTSNGDRYEPLPPIPQLPRYLWRRLPRPARIVVALAPLLILALIVLLAPGIERSKHERREADERRLAQAQAERARELRREQRPRFARSDSVASVGSAPATRLAARRRLLSGATTAMLVDARQRGLPGPIQRVECEPFPRTTTPSGAERDLSRRSGRYSCLAVTAEVEHTATQGRGIIGHPYRLQIDFESGRYAFCKISGRAAEGSLGRSRPIGVPHACGGR